MHSVWTPFPFIRIVIGYMMGILLMRFYGANLEEQYLLYACISLFSLLLVTRIFKFRLANSLTGNICSLALLLLGSYHFDQTENHELIEQHEAQLDSLQAFEGTIISYPQLKTKHDIHQVRLRKGIKDSTFTKLDFVIQLYVKEDSIHQIKYGDQIQFLGRVDRIPPPRNPHGFDYATYMSQQNIHFQAFAKSSETKVVNHDAGSPILGAIFQLRQRFEQTIHKHIKGNEERGIALALLLGIKSGLDPEVKAAYAATGAMHVLAVSGLHVGIIYLILSFVLQWIPSYTFQKYGVPLVSIAALWCYAVLTGFSPSILRAVTMLTVVIFGQTLHRRANTYNSLAVAAFVLLVYNPVFLFSVGFQLSFLAVIGIVFTYPKLYELIHFDNPLFDKAWSLTCVSIAAQIGTFPLSIYYFNQFPNYFLLSNFIVIPAAFVLMILGIALFAVGYFEFARYIGWLMQKITHWMNLGIEYIQNINGSVTDWLHISLTEMILLYAILGSLALYFLHRQMKYFYVIFILTGLAVLDRSLALTKQAEIHMMTFYSTRNAHYMDNIHGFDAQLFSLDSIANDKVINYQIASNRLHSHLPAPDTVQYIRRDTTALGDFGHFAVQNGYKILYIFKRMDYNHIKLKLNCDLLIISNQSIYSLKKLKEVIDAGEIILDSTNGRRYVDRLKKEANELNIPLRDNQAYALNIY